MTTKDSVEETEAFAKEAAENWKTGRELTLWIFDKAIGEFLGGTRFHAIKLCHTGRTYPKIGRDL